MHILMIESNPAGIHGIKKAIAAGHHVTFITVDPGFYLATNPETEEVFAHAACHVVQDHNIFDIKNLLQLSAKIHKEKPIDGVTTYSEYHVIHTAEVAKHLKLPGMSVEGAKNARLKHRTREKLKNTQIPQPKFIHVNNQANLLSAIEIIGFPCVIKPSDGTASLHVAFLKDQTDLNEYLKNLNSTNHYGRGVTRTEDLLVEEFIAGDLVSVESCVLSKGKIVNLGITDRILSGFPYFIEMGCTYFDNHSLKEQLFALNTQVLQHLGIDFGFIHTEFLLSPNGPVLCEVNGRLVGGIAPQLMELSSNIDPFLEVINLALGKEPKMAFPGKTIACGRFFGSPIAGKLNSIDFGNMEKTPGFIESICYKKSGDKINSLSKSNFDWLGHVIFTDKTRDLAAQKAESALDKISLQLDVDVAR